VRFIYQNIAPYESPRSCEFLKLDNADDFVSASRIFSQRSRVLSGRDNYAGTNNPHANPTIYGYVLFKNYPRHYQYQNDSQCHERISKAQAASRDCDNPCQCSRDGAS